MKKFFIAFGFVSLLTYCGSPDAEQAKTQATVSGLRRHTEYLAADSCQGRKPFSPGADRAVNYLAAEMKKIGLEGIGGDSFFQQVPLVRHKTECSDRMRVRTPGGTLSLEYIRDFFAFSKRREPEINIEKAQLVFAGYGIVAPEYGKNDYAGIENPGGKVALILVNDPGLDSGTDYFKGDTMTYYGRWTYKFEEAARAGLKGALIIHQTRGAGYPWSVVTASSGGKLYIDDKNDTTYHCFLEGWITEESAARMLAGCGYGLDELIKEAKKPGFRPVDLPAEASVSMKTEFTYNSSPNVGGYIRGSSENGESIVYIAHWDHLGYGKPVGGDSLINGATDNATAVAWLLETARAFKALKKQPERNIVFLCPTCEETGFLGTGYYVNHPVFPIDKTVAVINLDIVPLWGANNDVTITGYGHSSLDEAVAGLARKYGRYVMPDPEAFNGMFYRSDHFPFVLKGIPAMFAKGWNDNREKGKKWSEAKIKDYWANVYHKPADETHPETDNYEGVMQEVHLFFDLGYRLADSEEYPQWKPGSEFGKNAPCRK